MFEFSDEVVYGGDADPDDSNAASDNDNEVAAMAALMTTMRRQRNMWSHVTRGVTPPFSCACVTDH